MHFRTFSLLLPNLVAAYPWAANIATGGDLQLANEQFSASLGKRATLCPTHLTRQGAAPYSSFYPSKYTGAMNGKAGTGKGGVLVPAEGDTAHAYTAPGANDIRGPCPGLNALANHNFLSHDGLTTYNEMVDAAQNVYNWKHDLAVFVATFGVVQDGDVLTEMLSIGCTPGLQVPDTGLETHNKFEADASLSRTDYALSPTGDAYSLNGSLFGDMVNSCSSNNFDADCMGVYSQARYEQSLATNGNFFNGPLSFFVYGTALLPYNSFANFASGSPDASVDTIASFWGATQADDGSWYYTYNERIPSEWYNRPTAYGLYTIASAVFELYNTYPAPLGGNTGAPNTFVGLNYPGFVENGTLENDSPQGILCLFYEIATIGLPTSLLQTLHLSGAASTFAKGKLSGIFAGFGCVT